MILTGKREFCCSSTAATMSGIPTYRMIRKLGSRGRCASSHTSGIATHRERTPQQAHALIEALGLSLYEKTLCCSTLAEATCSLQISITGSPQQPQGMHTSAIYLASCTQLNHDALSWFSASISSGCLQNGTAGSSIDRCKSINADSKGVHQEQARVGTAL